MKKIIFANLDILASSFGTIDVTQIRDKFLAKAENLCSTGENHIVFESMHMDKLNYVKSIFTPDKYPYFKFMKRSDVKNIVINNRNKNYLFVFLSGKEQDFHIAVQSKSLFIVPTWIPVDDKSMFYGIHVDTPKQFFKFIKTLNNQNHWFATLNIEPNVTAL